MVKETDTVPCRYCKQAISPTAKRCPHCGTISPNLQVKSIFGIIFLMLGAFFLYTWLMPS